MYDVERVKYLPQWMSVYNIPSSGSLLYNFLTSTQLESNSNIVRDIEDYYGGRTFSSWGHLRQGWFIYSAQLGEQITTIKLYVYSNTGNSTGDVTRSYTLHDFAYSLDPTFYFDTSGRILFRNLEVLTLTTTPASDFSVSLEPLVEDADVWYLQEQAYERIPAHTANVDHTSGAITLPQRIPSIIKYATKALTTSIDSSGFVSINNGPQVKLVPIDYPNVWDDIAVQASMVRYLREDNYSLYLRVLAMQYVVGKPNKDILMSMISVDSDMVSCVTWVPSSYLDLTTFGNVTNVIVDTVNQYQIISEIPNKIGYNTYRTSRSPVPSTVRVLVAGFSTVPASVIADTVILYTDPMAPPEISYLYQVYEVEKVNGFITKVSAIAKNLPVLPYKVFVTKGIKVLPLTGRDIENQLYTENGIATQLFQELAVLLQEKIRISLGYIPWDKELWFTTSDVTPQVSYLPRELDR